MILGYGKQYLIIPRGDEIKGIKINGWKPLQICSSLWFVQGSFSALWWISTTGPPFLSFRPLFLVSVVQEVVKPQHWRTLGSVLTVPHPCAHSNNFTLPCSDVTHERPWPKRKGRQDRWWARQASRGNQLLRLMLFCKISVLYFGVLAVGVSWDLFCASCGGLGKDFAWAHLQRWLWNVREKLLVV